MSENGTFERLSSTMAEDDKIRLLKKIKESSDLSDRSLLDEETALQCDNNEMLFARLTWFRKILLSIVGFFTGKSPMSVFVSDIITKEGRSIDLAFPGVYDYQHDCLKEDFQIELKKLKEAARFFYTALDSSVNKQSGEFFVFLGSAEMPEIHKTLLEGTDPAVYVFENPKASVNQVRQTALDFVDHKLSTISGSHRDTMYKNARSLLYLKQLASFLYDRLILSFNKRPGDNSIICPVNIVKNQLISLCNILYSLRTTPSITLLSSMFVFIMQEHTNEDGYDEELEVQKFTKRAEKALDTIRTFNRRIPITRILRCSQKDLSYAPQEISGGEDWFVRYRERWMAKVNEEFNDFIISKRREHINHLYEDLFGGLEIESFENVQSKDYPDGVPVDEIQNIAILMAFHKYIFMPEINIVLRPILINGDFEKKENRVEFTESYSVLIKLDDTIKSFTVKLSGGGEFGKRWEQLNSEVQSVTVRRRRSSGLFEEIRYIENNIIKETYAQLIIMKKILTGIVGHKEDVSYGLLTNLAQIAGKGTTFVDGLNSGLEKLNKMVILVNEIRKINDID
ncbi:hypothetical protein FACS1894102_2620 [Spirochaetia bacterium]|nr:hypothetical protein FACS1894102_2620 [Spirochaetia bacterium]